MSFITWSSPIRKRGSVCLSPIPNEIYQEIFNYLRPENPNERIDTQQRKDLSNVALVCRFFSSIMIPWIFENLEFVEKPSQRSDTGAFLTNFCRKVLDGDAEALLLAKHVKRWSFFGAIPHSSWALVFLSLHFETLQHMPNLIQLSFISLLISKDFFKCVQKVHNLEILKLVHCRFEHDVRLKHLKKLESLRLRQLTLESLQPSPSDDLRSLIPHFNMSSLLHLEIDLASGLISLPIPNNDLPLESFSLTGYKLDEIMEFLKKTPHLKIIRLHGEGMAGFFSEAQLSGLSPQVIPRLIEFKGPWSLVTKILPGRNISRLEVTPRLVGEEDLDILTSFKEPVVELEVSEPLIDPTSVNYWRESIKHLIQRWKCFPNLHFLGLTFFCTPMDSEIDDEETQILELLNTTFPYLTRAEFVFPSPCKTWRYTRVVGEPWNRTHLTKFKPYSYGHIRSIEDYMLRHAL